MVKKEKTRLVLIDGNNLAYRAFYALPDTITTSSGIETNAVYGFTSMLLRLLEDMDPDRIICAMDSSGPTFRHEIFAEYKANRKEMPQSLANQIGLIKEVLGSFGIPSVERQGLEADDIIATLVSDTKGKYDEIIIASSDKDILQLVDDDVKVLASKRGITDTVLYDDEKIEKKYGIPAVNIKDYLALTGDSSDNIPGIRGIGPKTAAGLINSYGSIKDIYEDIGKEKNMKLKSLIESNKEVALRSLELVKLKHIQDLDTARLIEEKIPLKLDKIDQTLSSLEFTSLKKRFAGIYHDLRYFSGLTLEEDNKESKDVDMVMVESPGQVKGILNSIKKEEEIALGLLDERYYEGLAPEIADIKGLLVKGKEQGVYVIPKDILENRSTVDSLKDVLEDTSIEKTGFGLKSVFRFLYELGIIIKGNLIDYKIIYLILNPLKANTSIVEVIDYVFEEGAVGFLPSQRKAKTGRKQMTLDFEECDKRLDKKDIAEKYNCLLKGFSMFSKVKDLIIEKLEKKGAKRLYFEIEGPLIAILAEMESKGVCIDKDYINDLIIDYTKDIEKLTSDIYRLSGSTFNINSPQQLSEILFDKLGLNAIKKTKTGYSTDAATLSALADSHPIISRIMDYREKVKLKNTYLDVLPNLIDEKDKRVHTNYNQLGTTTGRISSNDPNLQNIPVRTDLGRQIRKAFIPGKGFDFLLSADYSQIELRVLAHMSKDENLIKAFNLDKDIHTSTAAEIFDVGYEDIDENLRRKAKAINFGIIYGMTEFGLKNRLKITEQEAREYIELYFSRYPGVRSYLASLVKDAVKKGYAETMFGRRRYINELSSSNANIRSLGERLAINTPIQGSAADIMKLSTILLYKNLKENNIESNIVLHVHDEIVLEFKEKDTDLIKEVAKKSLENCMRLEVKLRVDLKFGSNWYI